MTSTAQFDYTSRDFASVKAAIISRIPELLPEWTSRSPADFGMVLVDLYAYSVDLANFYGDRIANEAFLATATQRSSVLALAQMLDYTPAGPAAATVTVTFTIDSGHVGNVTIPAATQVSTVGTSTQDPIVFETDADVTIAPGASGDIGATQGETVTDEDVGTSDGSVDQSYDLFQYPVISDTVNLYVDEGAGAVLWTYLTHLIDATTNQKAYTLTTDEAGVVSIVFGDGSNGKIPALGATITATYRVGGGVSGNVGAGTITQAVGSLSGVSAITNATSASGGSDAETLDEIRVNAPRSLRAINRGVTLADYATVAEQVSGVALAKATGTTSTAVTVYVAPVGGDLPSSDLKTAVAAYLADRKMFSSSISVSDPTYTDINITINPLRVLPQYNRTAVLTAVEAVLNEFLDTGSVEFGQYIALSDIYQAILSVEGVEYATVTVLDDGVGMSLNDVDLPDSEIPQAGTISVTATGGLLGT